LTKEYETGQAALSELEGRARTLRDQLLRISGALRLLDEELADADRAPPAQLAEPAHPAPPDEPAHPAPCTDGS
jgi:hypothetical protein